MQQNTKSINQAQVIYNQITIEAPAYGPSDINKFKSRKYQKECERLFDEAIVQKQNVNSLVEENTKLKTRIQILYNQLIKIEKQMTELL